jgi:threonine/homoserine/homoserine lactone efflux protein
MDLDIFLQGLIAGYGIAVPVGPIGILIIELGIRRGFSVAFSAGLGAASADLIYATVAGVAGSFLVRILIPISPIIHYVSASALIAIGVWMFYQGRSSRRSKETKQPTSSHDSISCPSTYVTFFGLTLLNPLTVTYFTSLILGLRVNVIVSALDVMIFVIGTFLASLSWQTFLALVSGLSHKRLSRRVQAATFTLGNCVVIALGVLIFLGFRI